MPRPTAAQIAYGSATVVCSTLVILLLSGTTTGIGIAMTGIAALALGLLVTMVLTLPGRSPARSAAYGRRGAAQTEARDIRVPGQRVGASGEGVPAEQRHSLRR
ncbi:hypothetical protein [Streptomyces hebeiensis]